MRTVLVTFASISIGLLGGCKDSAQSGTLIGAGGGALAGQAIGGNTKGSEALMDRTIRQLQYSASSCGSGVPLACTVGKAHR